MNLLLAGSIELIKNLRGVDVVFVIAEPTGAVALSNNLYLSSIVNLGAVGSPSVLASPSVVLMNSFTFAWYL